MGLLAILWVAGLIAYFTLTTERQRETALVVAWILLLAPILVLPITRLLSP